MRSYLFSKDSAIIQDNTGLLSRLYYQLVLASVVSSRTLFG